MAATKIATIVPATPPATDVGTWLVDLELTITSTILPDNLLTVGLPHFDLTWPGHGATILLPDGPDEIVSIHHVCFLFETTAPADELVISGESFQLDGGAVSVEAAASLVLVGTPEEETVAATRVNIKPGSKLHTYRQGDQA